MKVYINEGNVPQHVEKLFENWQEAIVWSCLQGVMGAVYTDNEKTPASAAAVLGDFAFFAGRADAGFLAAVGKAINRGFVIMVPQSRDWERMIEGCYGSRAGKVTRYAIKKEPGIFQRERLQAAEKPGGGYVLQKIEKTVFEKCKELPWSRDLVSQYASYEDYREKGLGMAVLYEGEPVAGASAYARYRDGIEIEIDTREDFRRKGLAYACGAALILECEKQGLYPSWDAQNLWSVALAEKLGYHFDRAYTAYEVELAEKETLRWEDARKVLEIMLQCL